MLMEESYEMITEILVKEVNSDKYVMVADGIPAKDAEDRFGGPTNLKIICNGCTFNFASLMIG